tara:strand:+ start:1654 stop:2433 length:780 start_codon:yes stop_codon:yes gene_type:complete
MKIASWNVNSVRTRIDNILEWIKKEDPDILCLQEIKVITEGFPSQPFEDLGYNLVINGQKSYNGVATLSKPLIEESITKIPNLDDDQARYIETVHSVNSKVIRIANIYLPNGNPYPGDKFDYKLNWMIALKKHLNSLKFRDESFILLGDFNVIPENIDAYDADNWINDALFAIETRKEFREIISLGLNDMYRAYNPQTKDFTFWDYQRGAWQKNEGIRIDHILASPIAADQITNVIIDKEERDKEKPSDHVPIIADVNI